MLGLGWGTWCVWVWRCMVVPERDGGDGGGEVAVLMGVALVIC